MLSGRSSHKSCFRFLFIHDFTSLPDIDTTTGMGCFDAKKGIGLIDGKADAPHWLMESGWIRSLYREDCHRLSSS